MNHKAKRILLLGITLLLGSSCGTKTIYVTATTTIVETTASRPTTSVVEYGGDCWRSVGVENDKMWNEYRDTLDSRGEDRVPSEEEWQEESSVLRKIRAHYRFLDIPLLQKERDQLVNAIFDFLSAYNRYMESDQQDLGLNDFNVLMVDALTDFLTAWNDICWTRGN